MRYIDIFDSGERFVSGYESVVNSVKRLLMTRVDSWVLKPGYGVDLEQFLEETDVDEFYITEVITNAVAIYEPRVSVLGVDVVKEEHELQIKLRFSVPEFAKVGEVILGVTND